MSFSFKSECSNLLPLGKYKAQVTDIKFAPGSSTINVTLTIAEGPYAKRVHTETIPEKAYSFKLMPFLKACKVDIDREFNTKEELYKFGFAAAKGKFIMVDMGTRTYQGTEYNNVTSFSPLADSTTSIDEVAEAFATEPEVKASALDGKVQEEMNIPEDAGADEPNLDVDLSNIESPVPEDDDNPF